MLTTEDRRLFTRSCRPQAPAAVGVRAYTGGVGAQASDCTALRETAPTAALARTCAPLRAAVTLRSHVQRSGSSTVDVAAARRICKLRLGESRQFSRWRSQRRAELLTSLCTKSSAVPFAGAAETAVDPGADGRCQVTGLGEACWTRTVSAAWDAPAARTGSPHRAAHPQLRHALVRALSYNEPQAQLSRDSRPREIAPPPYRPKHLKTYLACG